MAEFIQNTEQFVNVNESVVFVNNTDSNFEVGTGIIFRKSGLYEISVVGNKITVTKVSDLTKASKFEGMTNGEVIKAVFPYVDTAIEELLNRPIWWNESYKGVEE